MKTIGQIINHNSVLEKLISTAKNLQYLNGVFRSVLETSLSQHCHLSKIDGTKLTVTVDSPAWASIFRYEIPEILKNLQSQPEFKDIKSIRYLVGNNK